jgi:hypothetical protein
MNKVVLDETQLLQLKKFIILKGIKEEDVIHEILDHFACKVEELMNDNIYLSFEKAIELAYFSFGYNGFKKMSLQYEERMKKMVWAEFKPALLQVIQSKLIVCSFVWCACLYVMMLLIELYQIDNQIHEFVTYSSFISLLVFYGIRFYSSMIAKDGLADLAFDKSIKMWQKKVVKMPKIDSLNLLLILALILLKFDPNYYILCFMTMAFLGLVNSLTRKKTMIRMNNKLNDHFVYE